MDVVNAILFLKVITYKTSPKMPLQTYTSSRISVS